MVVKGQSDWDMAGVILADGSGWGARNRRRGIEFEVEPTPIGPVRLLAVSDQQERGVGVLEDGTAKAIDGSDLTTLKGRFSDAIAAAAAGTGVAVLTPDRAQLFAHETGEQMGEIVKGYGKLTCLALDGYRKWFVAGSSQGEVQGYRATSKGSSAVQLASAKSSFDGLTALAFVRDHRHPEATKGGTEYPRNLLVLGYRSGRVAVHDPLEDKHLGDLDPMLEGIQRLEVTVEEDRLLVLGEKGALRMYEVPAGAPPTQATPTPPAGKPFEGWTIVPR